MPLAMGINHNTVVNRTQSSLLGSLAWPRWLACLPCCLLNLSLDMTLSGERRGFPRPSVARPGGLPFYLPPSDDGGRR